MTKQSKTDASENFENAGAADVQQQDAAAGTVEAAPAAVAGDPSLTLADVEAAVAASLDVKLPELVEAVKAAGPSVDDVKAYLAEAVAAQLPQLVEAKVDALVAKIEAARALESGVVQREKAAKAEKSATALERAAAKALSEARADSAAKYQLLFGDGGSAPFPAIVDLPPASYAVMLDDGERFALGYVQYVVPADLKLDDERTIRLAAALNLPGDVEPFTVRGVSLHFGNHGAVRCALPTPLAIGDGRTAHLAADSLVFRATVATVAAAPVDAQAA